MGFNPLMIPTSFVRLNSIYLECIARIVCKLLHISHVMGHELGKYTAE